MILKTVPFLISVAPSISVFMSGIGHVLESDMQTLSLPLQKWQFFFVSKDQCSEMCKKNQIFRLTRLSFKISETGEFCEADSETQASDTR